MKPEAAKRTWFEGGRKAAAMAAFSLVELIVTITIIGVLAAIAVPRLSRGMQDAAPNALQEDISILQRQLELYAAEHGGVYPGYNADGANPAHGAEAFLAQLTGFSDPNGLTAAARDATFRFGPYLRGGLPTLMIGPHAGQNGVRVLTGATALQYQAGDPVGWVYHDVLGEIIPNIPDGTDWVEETSQQATTSTKAGGSKYKGGGATAEEQ